MYQGLGEVLGVHVVNTRLLQPGQEGSMQGVEGPGCVQSGGRAVCAEGGAPLLSISVTLGK